MDVRCSRCGTEYEFDDALISERGTTVKCTNCGFQFKIFPGEGKGAAPERWVVRTASGRELVYTSLRELQRGIADKKVGPQDLLSRGKQAPRPLASIAELEPFFQVQPSRNAAELERAQRTLHGVAPPANSIGGTLIQAGRFAPPPAPESPPAPAPRAPSAPITRTLGSEPAALRAPEFEPAPATARVVTAPGGINPSREQLDTSTHNPPADFPRDPHTTLPAGSGGLTPQTPAENAPNLPYAPMPAPAPAPMPVAPLGFGENKPDSVTQPRGPTPQPPRTSNFDSTLEVPLSPRGPVSSPRNIPPISVENMRDSFASYDELDLNAVPDDSHARRARSRWIAGVVIIGVIGLLGATVGRRYLAQLAGGSEVKTSSDARVAKFLGDGAALLDEGDFEGAKEAFDKATVLAEKDPAVLTALARLETLRTDVTWLKLRLLDPNSTDLVQATYRELARRVGKARVAVDRAFAVSPEDPAVLRARVDVLRLSGEGDKAREWIAPLSSNASVPENAYVLAALDLGEPSPVWPSVIDRLRTAAAAERDPGRARAALIYALARAGRMSEAQAEFTKIDGRTKPHPLLEELRAFLQRASTASDAGVDAAPKLAAVDPTKLPKLDTLRGEEPEPAAAAAAAAPAAPGGDFRARLSQAATALREGDLSRAEQLYDSVLSEQPNNTEALSGLGDVAKQRRDPATAARMYDRVLAQNPSYLPAILASADQKWDSGDKKGALVLYRQLLEQAGPSSQYGAHAAARIAQGEGSSGASPAPTETAHPQKPAAAPTSEAPSTPPADIDTTDLPGAR
ncbi:MAG TPA: zinc-ribbon domain-containing protein [Polyangiaceae bacterium]|jgi:predicted Zn finger-like uncharacterized protein|nr:zinc-ribbon domain-containing protein [Polyangiaceae bacterium]